jgi:hypothetical protein
MRMPDSVTLYGLAPYGTLTGNQLSDSLGAYPSLIGTLSWDSSSLIVGQIVDFSANHISGSEIYEGYILNNGVEDPVTSSGNSYTVFGYSGNANQTIYFLPYVFPTPTSEYSLTYTSFAEYGAYSGGALSNFHEAVTNATFELTSQSASVAVGDTVSFTITEGGQTLPESGATYEGYVAYDGADYPVLDDGGAYFLVGGGEATPTSVAPDAYSISMATPPPPPTDFFSAKFDSLASYFYDLNGSLSGYGGATSQGVYQLESPLPSVSVGDSVTFLLSVPGQATVPLTATYEGYVAVDGVDLPIITYEEPGELEPYYLILGGGANTSTHSTQSDYALNPACYLRGTLIATQSGEVPIETLAVGDGVVTASGLVRRIKWIGHRSYAGRFVAANPALHPIRLRAACLGAGLPRRDLLVSPEHAMVIDGLLIPAHCLVNGRSIVKEPATARLDYFHVELDSHDVLLAEGAASESFLDDDSRGLFHNAAEYATLHPDAPPPGEFCARRVNSGPELDTIRCRLGASSVQEVRLDAEGFHHIAIDRDVSVVRLVTDTG